MADEVMRLPITVQKGVSKLLRLCQCGGYARKPPICAEWSGPEDVCYVCVPLRNFLLKQYGVDFGSLT